MTTKQIAEAVGKDERTVQRWARKVSENNRSIANKQMHSSSTHPADYDFDETIEIIRSGMGENAAEVYKHSAQNGWTPDRSVQIDPPGWVYLVFDESNELYKIGITRSDLKVRLSSLKTSNPFLLLVGAGRFDDPRATESKLHELFAERRIRGEWFELTREDVGLIVHSFGLNLFIEGDAA